MIITLVSVLVALIVGGIEALGLFSDHLALKGLFWGAIGSLNDNFGMLGYGIIGVFLASWAGSVALYRMRGFDKINKLDLKI